MSDLLISMYEDLDKITDNNTKPITSSDIDGFMAKYNFVIKNMGDMMQLLVQYNDYRKESDK